MTITTKANLAAELRVSKARVSQYGAAGMPIRPDGKIDREQALAWIVKNVTPDVEDKGAARAAKLLSEARARRRPAAPCRSLACPGRGEPDLPPCFQPALECEVPEEGALLLGMLMLAYRLPAQLVSIAAGSGAPLKSVFAMHGAFKYWMFVAIGQTLAEAGVKPRLF